MQGMLWKGSGLGGDVGIDLFVKMAVLRVGPTSSEDRQKSSGFRVSFVTVDS